VKKSATFSVPGLGFAAIVIFIALGTVVIRFSPTAHASGSDDKQQLIDLEEKWNTLAQNKDANTVSDLMRDDYYYVGTEGEIGDKALLLKHMREGEPDEPRYKSYRVDQITPRLFGNIAVITGRWVGQGTDQDPSAMKQERWTDVWVKDAGKWRCFVSQSTVIPGK
jgi:ketosteroid isomerase-like protein